MILYTPNYDPKKGDQITAEREETWGHLAQSAPIDEDEDMVIVTIGERLDVPRGWDTFEAIVNGEETTIHIDTLTDLVGLADALKLERGTLSELDREKRMKYEKHHEMRYNSDIFENEGYRVSIDDE
jgi:hypothetical protein